MEISDDKIYTLLTIATDGSNLFGIDSGGYYDEITIWDNGRSFYIMSYGDVKFSLVEEYYGN